MTAEESMLKLPIGVILPNKTRLTRSVFRLRFNGLSHELQHSGDTLGIQRDSDREMKWLHSDSFPLEGASSRQSREAIRS